MLKTYFKIALRNLFKNKTYTFLNVFGLAIGLACFILIALWVKNELSYDKYHSKADRVYRIAGKVETDSETFDQAVTSPPVAEAMIKDFPEVENAVRMVLRDCIVRYEEKQFAEDDILFADQSFFEIFDYELISGNKNSALTDPYSIILTKSMAEKYFGDDNPIGKSLTMFIFDPEGNGAQYKINGVIADPPKNSHITYNIIGSFNTLGTANPNMLTSEWRWFWNGFYTYILLKKGADPNSLEAKLPGFIERYMGDKEREMNMFYTYSLQPLPDIYLHSDLRYEIYQTGSMDTVLIFATIGIFILLLACINYMNLSTARSITRAKEVGVKKVLGAAKFDLIKQFISESLFITLISLGISLLLLELFQPFFFELTGKEILFTYSPDMLLLLLGTVLFVGIISGIYPAFILSSFKPAKVLKGTFKSSSSGIFLRKGLVVFQFTISVALLAGILVVNNQMNFIKDKNLGFDKEGLLILDVNGFSEVQSGIERFKNDLLFNPAVLGVATSRGLLVGGLSNSLFTTIDGKGKEVSSSIYRYAVSPEFFNVYNMKLIAGRDFKTDYSDTLGSYILNESAVNSFGWKDAGEALGKPFNPGSTGEGKIIGVVNNFHYTSLQQAIEPVAINLTTPNYFSRISVKLNTADLASAINFIKDKWDIHFPGTLLQYSFIDERLSKQYAEEELFGKVISFFVILSLIIACLGLFGLASFSTVQRTKEISIRKILGSSFSNILFLLSKDFLKLVLIANIAAWPLAYLIMNKWLEDFAYRIDISIWPFIASGIAALIISFLTIGYQAMKAAIANPVNSLRYE